MRASCRRARPRTMRRRASAAAAHRTLRDVTADYEAFRFNTMVAKLMELTNTLFRYRGTPVAGDSRVGRGDPAAAADAGPGRARTSPRSSGRAAPRPPAGAWTSIHTESWPEVDESATVVSVREVPVQVNGKLRDKVIVAADATPRTRSRPRSWPARRSRRSSPAGRRTGSSRRRRQARQHRPARRLTAGVADPLASIGRPGDV